MPSVHFVETSGERKTFEGKEGESVMELAVRSGIPQIEAECGGAMACATCHVYVDPDWFARLPARSEFEEDMLDMADDEPRPESRLSCQIKLDTSLDGLTILLTR